jgi:hypothetical protein
MKNRLLTFAGALTVLALLGHFYAKPLLAQVRAALVENVDEPGRNPYQETIFATCTGSQFCNQGFSMVPAGKRLVLTNISGYVDVTAGTLPNGDITSSLGGSQYATVFFTGVRGTVSSFGTRMVINQEIRAYFGPGETPHVFEGLVSTSDTFSDGANVMLSGYYVNLP